jgi:23S rRNA pseudouridine1911/1915/1917 synthase
MKPTKFTVDSSQNGMTLMEFIAAALGLSRNRAKALVDTRNVFVNRRRVWMARHTLTPGDVIEMSEVGSQQPAPPKRLRILFTDDQYVVVDKPAGMLSNGPASAESVLQEQIALPSLVAVHRLDRDTSGCLLLAKNARAFDAAVAQFRKCDVSKTYHAIVRGQLDPPNQKISTPIQGEHAVTRVKTLAASTAASHVLLNIETGRTHQIRRHLAAAGTPIIGDSHYGVRTEATRKTLYVTRQMLHASSIEFTHPLTQRRINVTSPLPADFRRCLDLFKLR